VFIILFVLIFWVAGRQRDVVELYSGLYMAVIM